MKDDATIIKVEFTGLTADTVEDTEVVIDDNGEEISLALVR